MDRLDGLVDILLAGQTSGAFGECLRDVARHLRQTLSICRLTVVAVDDRTSLLHHHDRLLDHLLSSVDDLVLLVRVWA